MNSLREKLREQNFDLKRGNAYRIGRAIKIERNFFEQELSAEII